jgi:hypothetical protein
MNSIQKRSLLFTFIFAIQYGLIIQFPQLLPLVLGLVVVTNASLLFYFFKINFDKKEILDSLKFLSLPVLFNLGALFYVQSVMQPVITYALVAAVSLANYFLLVALKRVHNLENRAAVFQRNVVISVAFLSLFFSLSAIFRFYITYSTNSDFQFPLFVVVIFTGVVFYIISYFLAWENGISLTKFRPYNLVISLLGAEAAWVSSIWVVNYPVFSSYEKANLAGTPIPAIILTIIFYFTWGVVSHKADKSLTQNVILQYIVLTLLFLFVLFISARWLPQI